MTATTFAPIPVQDPISRPRNKNIKEGERDPHEGLITDPWAKWFNTQTQTIESTPSRTGSIALTSQGASIAATAIANTFISNGVYRLTYYARITTRASTGAQTSSLTVTYGWTDDGAAKTKTFSAITGNFITTVDSQTFMFTADGASPITYSTTYASDTAGQMQYKLYLKLELIS